MKTNTKNIMKALAIVLGLALTATTEGMAQSKAASGKASVSTIVTDLNVQDMGNLRFKLAFENPLRQKTKIYLLDKENNLFFTDYASDDTQYIRTFNLSNLGDGQYTFVVENGKDKLTKDFVISTKTFRGISLANNRK